MTASALASPALSESSITSSSMASFQKAQTTSLSHDQSALFLVDSANIVSAPSPASSSSSFSSSPSPPQAHAELSQPIHPFFTPSAAQQHHHIQILGNHPASPVNCTFLDLPEDPFMPTRANMLFSDSEYKQDYQEPAYENENFIPYTTASSEDSYSQRVKAELANDQFSLGVSNPYMMSMARSFSDSQIADMCESSGVMFDSSASALASQVSLGHATGAIREMDMCQSPLSYTGSQVVYNDDYYVSAQQHSQYYHHQHNYSTSSLPSISEDSSLSPRSSFSSNSSMSLSSSCPSIGPSYPLARTMSEPTIPFFQMGSNSSTSAVPSATGSATTTTPATAADGTPLVKPTPKRSRGRRVSCNPDITGCKVFTCRYDDCGKVFKRSEHLKRHVRSIHTMEKPFECPIHNCPKRFSRSDNLNQHIRIHRHNGRGEKSKSFSAFTPFMQGYSAELISIS
ncbi:hypothetical protein BGX34_006892 [Mortierella sp. NVP85]|nr:hypothetical protein BGX34_006892 [Mortierella sp. NVP85]